MQQIGLKKVFLAGYFSVFLIVWLAITGYTFLAIFNSALPYSLELFGGFLIALDALLLPLIFLWWGWGSQTILHKTAVMLTTIIVVLWWGVFTAYSFLSLHLNDTQFRWIAFAYIWEVVIVGGIAAYAVIRVTRFAQRFLNGEIEENVLLHQDIHTRIAMIPMRSGIAFTSWVSIGYVIGSFQLYYFANLPITETIKNLLTGVITGTTASFLVFFFLERIIRPALQRSGVVVQEGGIQRKQKRLSVFKKIYAISGLLVLVSIGFIGPMAYARGQAILESQLKERLLYELTWVKLQYEKTGALIGEEESMIRFGKNRRLVLLTRPNGEDSLPGFPPQLRGLEEIYEVWSQEVRAPHVFIDRNQETKIALTFPLNDDMMLAAISFLKDFDEELNRLLFYSIALFLMIIGFVSVIASLFARSITMPVREIQEGAIRIGKGNFSQITVYTNDELEDLSHALNEASSQLKRSYAHLEEEIKKRTLELAQINELQQEQIGELDHTAKLLVKRDFELQQANEMLRELDQAKTQFVSVAAHQLRTPLSVNKWTFQMLLSGDFGELTVAQQEVLEKGNLTNEQMIDLVSDLLDVARIESGKLDYVFKPIELSSFLLDIKNLYIQKAKEKQIVFEIHIPEKGELEVRGDPVRLRMVFQNLLDNSFKFTFPGGAITLNFEVMNDMVEFRLRDNGIGIMKEDIPRLFTKFFRGANALSMDTRGTGLGLYIASNIVHNHGGRIWVLSEEGKGSRFFFTIPKVSINY